MVFMLDRSSSVGYFNHIKALDFIKNVVSFFTIGLNFTRVGIITFSTDSSIAFDLDQYTNIHNLQSAISDISYTGGVTNTPAAVESATTILNSSRNYGAREKSEGISKIAILITGM